MTLNLAELLQKHKAGDMNKQPIPLEDNVLLVDGLNSYLRAFAATPTMDDDGQHVGGVTGFLLSIGSIIRIFKPKKVIIVFDGPGGSQRRRAAFPDYKSGRRHMTKLNRSFEARTLEEEKQAVMQQLLLLIEMLGNLPVTILRQPNVEADDVIAYLAQVIEERSGKAIIVSSDKDFLQLVNDNIHVYNPVKKKLYNAPNVLEDYGFHPNNFLMYRVITGDKSDSIPGVMGIKEKTLLKFFPELVKPEKLSIQDVLESARNQASVMKKVPVALQAIIDSEKQLKLNESLMRLDEVAASPTTLSDVLNIFEKGSNKFNKIELTKLITSNKFTHVFKNYDIWLQETFVPLMRTNMKRDN